MEKIALLGIDLQNDFTSPFGSLYVKGADADIKRIKTFLFRNLNKIDHIILSLDSHQPIHIAHQSYWKNREGEYPPLFTVITLDDVKNGVWIPQYNEHLAIEYLQQLSQKSEFCTIWPVHCISGSKGWNIDGELIDCLDKWATTNNKQYEQVYKGHSQSTEHYSIFKAAVEWIDQPETSINTTLLSKLNEYDKIILVGEAADYCVANSLNDIIDNKELVKKLIILEDCMSWIDINNQKAKNIFMKAKKEGALFEKSINLIL